MSTNARTVTAKERPILFSRPMVQALRAGRKTQTRRVVKFPPNVNASELSRWHQGKYAGYGVKDGFVPLNRNGGIATLAFHDHHITCPYGVPGDRLWVKNAHRYYAGTDNTPERVWDESGVLRSRQDGVLLEDRPTTELQADDAPFTWKRRPSIHMPRWASRITLEVVSVRVERVESISDEEAKAEGIMAFTKDGKLMKWWPCDPCDGPLKSTWQDLPRSPQEAFLELFYGINKRAPRGSNPWVWVVEFRRFNP